MNATEAARRVTGAAASDAERRAAARLAARLRERNREVEVEPISVRISDTGTIAIHCALAVAGGLLGLKSPLPGAFICLVAAFSFYMERSLGIPLIGLILPKRASQNVISPPPTARIRDGITAILCSGYDLARPNPVNETVTRLSSGWLTVDRLAFWGGMVLVFLATMLRLAAADGYLADILQMLASIVLLCALAVQADRAIAGRPDPDASGLRPCEAVMAAIDEADEGAPLNARVPVAVCFFGAESVSAKGAGDWFSSHQVGTPQKRPLVINFSPGNGGKAEVTSREGDLATLRMDGADDLETEVKFTRVRLPRLTSATVARRHGLRAVTVIDNNDDAIDLGLDLIDSSLGEPGDG